MHPRHTSPAVRTCDLLLRDWLLSLGTAGPSRPARREGMPPPPTAVAAGWVARAAAAGAAGRAAVGLAGGAAATGLVAAAAAVAAPKSTVTAAGDGGCGAATAPPAAAGAVGCRCAGSLSCGEWGMAAGSQLTAGPADAWVLRSLACAGPHRRPQAGPPPRLTASCWKVQSEPLVQRPCRKKRQSCCPCTWRYAPALACGAQGAGETVFSNGRRRAGGGRARRRGPALRQRPRRGPGAATHRVMAEGAGTAFAACSTQEVRAVHKAPGVHGVLCGS